MNRYLGLVAPVLVALVPLARLLAANAAQVGPGDALPSAGLIVLCSTFAVTALRLATGDWFKAALVACAGWLLFFLDGAIFERWWDGRSLDAVPRLNYSLMGGEAAVLVVLAVVLRRWRFNAEPVVRWAAITAALLVLLSLGPVIGSRESAGGSDGAKGELLQAGPTLDPVPPATGAARPDVYHLILDGYARADVLAEVYGFDNRPFLAALQQRGFQVQADAYSNYSTTFLSLSATLNQRYHQAPDGRVPAEQKHYYRLIQDSATVRQFKALGYTVHWVASTWGGTERSAAADEVHRLVSPFFHSEFATVFWRGTPLRQFEPTVARSHLHAFSSLERISRRKEATYTFAHVLAPHNPYVFDAAGNIIANVPQALQFNRRVFTRSRRWNNQEAYVAQLQFINRRVLEVIDHVLAQPGPRPIFLLQSDHGSAFLVGKGGGDVPVARERHGVLNAVLAPAEVQAALAEHRTVINTYPVLWRAGYGLPVAPLEDRVYYSWYGDPYRFTDLTAPLLDSPRPAAHLAAAEPPGAE